MSPLAGSRHSVFRVKDGCCSWSPYISLTLRYSTTRAVKEIARKFRDIWRGFLIWLFRNLLGHNLKHAFQHISTRRPYCENFREISLTPLSTTHSGKDKNKMRCNLPPLLVAGRGKYSQLRRIPTEAPRTCGWGGQPEPGRAGQGSGQGNKII